MNLKTFFWIASIVFNLKNFAIASYISDKDELGEIAARYDMRDQVKGVPSLKINFDHLPPDVSSIYDSFKQAYINQNQFHIRVLHTSSHEFDELSESMCKDVYKIHYDQHRLMTAENEGFQQGACNVISELIHNGLKTVYLRHNCFKHLSELYEAVDRIDRMLEKLH